MICMHAHNYSIHCKALHRYHTTVHAWELAFLVYTVSSEYLVTQVILSNYNIAVYTANKYTVYKGFIWYFAVLQNYDVEWV